MIEKGILSNILRQPDVVKLVYEYCHVCHQSYFPEIAMLLGIFDDSNPRIILRSGVAAPASGILQLFYAALLGSSSFEYITMFAIQGIPHLEAALHRDQLPKRTPAFAHGDKSIKST